MFIAGSWHFSHFCDSKFPKSQFFFELCECCTASKFVVQPISYVRAQAAFTHFSLPLHSNSCELVDTVFFGPPALT